MTYYGKEIDQDAFLQKVAKEAQLYVDSQPWSKKMKERWINAYSDLMNHGITGVRVATEGNNAGFNEVTYDGEQIPTGGMKRKDRAMYEDAAWFIEKQMGSISPKEEEKKKDLTVFSNKDFIEGLNASIGNEWYGGQDWSVKDWNALDERDKTTGKRGIRNRADRLVQVLKNYAPTLKDKYNFEGSPFKDYDDFQNRVNEAITALQSKDTSDDNDALNRLGINPKTYFDDGLNDTFTYKGHEVAYKDLEKLRQLQGDLNAQEVKASINAPLEAIRKTLENAQAKADKLNLKPEKAKKTKKQETLGEHKFTDADYLDIGALIGDISSIVYPGFIGGAVLGTGAASARTAASAMRGDLNFWDRALDFGTGIVGGLPLFGDALMVGKVGKGIRMFIQSAGILEAFNNYPGLAAVSGKLSKGNFSDITVDEWKSMLQFFRGLTGAGRVVKSNRSLSKAAKASGLKVENNLARQITGWGPNVTKTTNTNIIKAKVNGNDIEVKLKQEEYNNLLKKLDKVKGKGSKEEGEKIIKEAIKDSPEVKAIKGDASDVKIEVTYSPTWRNKISFVKNNSKSQDIFGTKESQITGNSAEEFEKTIQNRKWWDKAVNGSNKALRQYRERLGLETLKRPITGQQSVTQQTGQQSQEKSPILLLPNKQPLVSNSPIERWQQTPLNIKEPIKQPSQPVRKVDLEEANRSLQEIRNFRKSYGFEGNSPMQQGFGEAAIKSGKITVDLGGEKVTFEVSRSDLKGIDRTKANFDGKVASIRGKIARQLEQASKNSDISETALAIRKLKAKGWLRQGGKLNNKIRYYGNKT